MKKGILVLSFISMLAMGMFFTSTNAEAKVPAYAEKFISQKSDAGSKGLAESNSEGKITLFQAVDQGKTYVVLCGLLEIEDGDYVQLFAGVKDGGPYVMVHEVLAQDMYTFSEEFGAENFSFYQHIVDGLDPNTEYEFVLRMFNKDGVPVGQDNDFGSTLLGDMKVHSVYPKNALPGDTVTITGENFGSGNHNDTSIGDSTCLENGSYCLYSEEWSNDRIKLQIPYDFLQQRGYEVRVHRQYQEFPIGLNEELTPIFSDQGEVELTTIDIYDSPYHYFNYGIASNYYGEQYLYMNNALEFRYGNVRKNIPKEQEEARLFRKRIEDTIGRSIGVDALWFLNLFTASYYGGYSDEDIITEVLHGPCAVNATIPKVAWKNTSDYQSCGK